MEVTSNASILQNKNYRIEYGKKIVDFEQAARSLGSLRKAADQTGIARTTYQHLRNREQQFDLNENVKIFFRSTDGVNFLHRIILAAEFVFSQLAGAGVSTIQRFYQLSQLDQIIANSDGVLCERLKTLENRIIEFGNEQFVHLGSSMPQKPITCALDETFPSGICLVGIDAVSNFILAEEFAEKRDSETWQQAMNAKLEHLPVTVIQVVSDEAKALIKYCQDYLNANHSPDLFHVQQEISKATSAPMGAKIKQAQAEYDHDLEAINDLLKEKMAYETLDVKPVGRPTDYEGWLDAHAQSFNESLNHLALMIQGSNEIKEATKGLGDDYHPYSLIDGAVRTAEQLQSDLAQRFEKIVTNATTAGLSENSQSKIAKANKVAKYMVSTMAFFWNWVDLEVGQLKLTDEQASLFKDTLLLLSYLELNIGKSRDAKERSERKQLLHTKIKELNLSTCWQSLNRAEKEVLKKAARKCAQIFQRSSSCVEGRNGQLSLMQHSNRSIKPRKLSSLTVVHNFFLTRSDGSTAAERFFEQKHQSLFEWLLERIDCPPLPAKKRAPKQKLQAVA